MHVRVFVVSIAALACATSASARGPASAAGRSDDPTTVESLRGEVTSEQTMPAAKGRSGGVHLTLGEFAQYR